MKRICAILILAVAGHGQCGVECLATSLTPMPVATSSATAESPCHQHAQDEPADRSEKDSSQHDKTNSCAQAQLLQSLNTTNLKFLLNTATHTLVNSFIHSAPAAERPTFWTVSNLPQQSSPPDHTPVLRI
jgi:hypothetical protein